MSKTILFPFAVPLFLRKAVRAACAAVFMGVSVVHAQYEGVQFYDQDVSGFDFRGMNMEGASFSSVTDMTGADFTGANVYGVYFTSAVGKGFTEEMLKSTRTYRDGVVHAALYYNDLSGWDLSGVDLQGALFTIGYPTNGMAGTNLSGSDIRHGYFQSAHAAGLTPGQIYATASYQQRDLTGVTFTASELASQDGAVVWNFADQNLTGADFWACVFTSKDGSQRVSFANAIVKDANFGAASSWNYNDCSLQFDHIRETLSYQQKDLGAIKLSDNDLRTWDFRGQNLEGASFLNANISGVDFTDAVIKDANFFWGKLNNRYFNNNDGGLTYEQLVSTKSYKDKDLGAINLGGKWDGEGADPMRNVRRDLSGWDLSEQNLQGASFFNANVRQTIFTDADITGADFSCEFDSVWGVGPVRNTTDTLTAAQLYSTASYRNKNLRGVSFDGISLEGWDFTGQDLTGANLATTDLTGTTFDGAVINGVSLNNTTKYGFTAEQLYSTASYRQGDLSGVRLTSNDLTGWDLSGKNLTGVSFDYSTMDNVNLEDSVIVGASFYNATTKGFTAEQLYATASYKHGDLRGVTFRGNSMSGWDFTAKNLQNAHFGYSSVAGINFTNADLRGANTNSSTDIDQATLKNTIWSDGVVKNVTLAMDGDYVLVKNYIPLTGTSYPVDNPYVITTKISDADVTMTGGRLIIETGAPLALVQHKSLTVSGGSIDMLFGNQEFGVINVYAESVFGITEQTSYFIDFGTFDRSASEYLMVDATCGGTISGLADWIDYTVMANGEDVSDEWVFAIADNGNLVIRMVNAPIPESGSVLLGLAAGIVAVLRRRRNA